MKPGKQRGVAAVELALILPVMLIVAFGITELGRALYQYNALVKATRDAVRYLAQQDLANLTVPERNAVYAKTKALAVCGAPDCTDAAAPPPVAPGLSTAQVSLCDYLTCDNTHKSVETTQGTVDLVSVTIGGASDDKVVIFKSIVQPATPEPFGWGIPDIRFAPIKATMASRYF